MKKTNLLIAIISIFFIPLVNGFTTIQIDVQPEFTIDERISFNYIFISDTAEKISYFASVDCPNGPIPLIALKEKELEKDVVIKESYDYLTVDERIEPQTCTAFVFILTPTEQTAQKNFTIVINPSFSFEIKTCKDQACREKSKTFVKNEDIYVAYTSEVLELSMVTTLTYPDKTTKQINLPTSIKAEQIGSYTLETIASKEGYKTITKKEQFGVIEEEAEIVFVGVCNADGICSGEEDSQNCPQDCISRKELVPIEEIKEEIKTKTNFLFIGIGVIILIGLTGLIIQLIRLKSEKRLEIMNIEEYIINTLRKGYSFSQIRKELLKEGFNKKEIEKAVKFATNILKSDRKKEIISLEEYIMNTKRYGYSFPQIRNELLREGWNKEEVDKAFDFVIKKR